MARRRRSTRRRRFRRRPRRRRRIMRSLMGQSKVVRHKWAHAGQFAVGGGNLIVTESFRLNSPSAPSLGSTTSQPLGFIQMNSIFRDCQVLGAKIVVTYLPASSQHPTVYWSEIATSSRQGQPSIQLGDIVNRKNTNYRFLATNAGNATTQRLVRKYSPKRYFHVKDLRDNAELKVTPASGVAIDECFLNTAYSTTHPGLLTAVGVCDYLITIDYIILWTRPEPNVP